MEIEEQQDAVIISISSEQTPPLPNLPIPDLLHEEQTPPLPNLPIPDLLHEDRRDDYVKIGIPLLEASMKGDWKSAQEILKRKLELVRCSLTQSCETALHVAVSGKKSKHMQQFLVYLLGCMSNEELELQDARSNTALCIAARAGNIQIVKIMLQRNSNLLTIPGAQQMMPLNMAALFGDHDTVEYMYTKSLELPHDTWNPKDRGWLFLKCVEADLFDVALRMLRDVPELSSNAGVLEALARKPMRITIKSFYGLRCLEKDSEALQLLKIIWSNISKKPKREIDAILRGQPDQIKKDDRLPYGKEDQSLHILKLISENIVNMPAEIQNIVSGFAATNSSNTNISPLGNAKTTFSSRVLFVAAEKGNTKFIVELLRLYPDLIWTVNDNNESIFHTAVKHRHEGIYNLLYEIGSKKEFIVPLRDDDDNNMLHLVGKVPKRNRLQDVPGVALQMQRELLWFQDVAAMVPPSYKEERNKDGLTPHELFTEEHKDLASLGEKWMRDTASQCMVVATLIATIVFAAAFTVPGGYNQTDGIPIFHLKKAFVTFVVADAISLLLSTTSISMFLSILTSRYAEDDFMVSLPTKLLIGLTTIFLSILAMIIAFGSGFFVLYDESLIRGPMLITMFAVLPIFLFGRLQFPFIRDVYGSRHLFRLKKGVLYSESPEF